MSFLIRGQFSGWRLLWLIWQNLWNAPETSPFHTARQAGMFLCVCVFCVHTHRLSLSPAQGPAPPRCSLHYSLQMREGSCVLCGKHIFKGENLVLRLGTHRLAPVHSEQLTSPFKNIKQTPYSELLCRNFENSALEMNSFWIISIMSDTEEPRLSEKRLTCQNMQMSGARREPKPHHQSCTLRFQYSQLCVSALGCIFESGGDCRLGSGIRPRLPLKSKIQKLQKDLLMD